MDSIFESVFHVIFKILRSIFIDIIFRIIVQIIVEGLFRTTGYCLVHFYRRHQRVRFDSDEVCIVGFLAWLFIILFCVYWFLIR